MAKSSTFFLFGHFRQKSEKARGDCGKSGRIPVLTVPAVFDRMNVYFPISFYLYRSIRLLAERGAPHGNCMAFADRLGSLIFAESVCSFSILRRRQRLVPASAALSHGVQAEILSSVRILLRFPYFCFGGDLP